MLTNSMINQNFTSEKNYNNFNKFNYNLALNRQKKGSLNTQNHAVNEVPDKNKTNLITASLLALAAAGGIVYLSIAKNGKNGLKVKRILEQNPEVKAIFDKFNSDKYITFENSKPLDALRCAVASLKAGKNTGIELPNAISFKNVSDDYISKFTELLADALSTGYSKYTYQGDMEAFIDTLSKSALRNTGGVKLINIGEEADFLRSFKHFEDTPLEGKFSALLNTLKQNNTVLVVNNPEFDKLFRRLNIQNSKNDFYCTSALQSDYKKMREKIISRMYCAVPELFSKFGEYGFEDADYAYYICEMMQKGNRKNLFAEFKDEKLRDKFIEQLSKECEIHELSHASSGQISEALKRLEKRYEIKETPQFLYLKDFSDMSKDDIDKNFSQLFEKVKEKYHTRLIIPSVNDKLSSNSIKPFVARIDEESMLEELQFKKTDIENIGIYIKGIQDSIRKGIGDKNGKIHLAVNDGPEEKTKGLMAYITDVLGIDRFTIAYEGKDSNNIVDVLSEQLKKAEERYRKTGKYSIIELRGIDEFFKSTASEKSTDMKEFTTTFENASSKFHSVLILRLNTPMESQNGKLAEILSRATKINI